MKKLTTILITCLLCISLLGTSAYAEDAQDPYIITDAETPEEISGEIITDAEIVTEAEIPDANTAADAYPVTGTDDNIDNDTSTSDDPGNQTTDNVSDADSVDTTPKSTVKHTGFGWFSYDNLTFLYDSTGHKTHGWYKNDDTQPYFSPIDGHMVTGWAEIDNKKYYFFEDGSRATGLVTIDWEKYYFNDKGQLQTGWITVGDVRPYFYPTDGHMATGWTTIKGYTFYFYENGDRARGWTVIDNYKPYFNENGVLATGLQVINGVTFLFDETGHRTVGWADVNGKKCFFDENGWLVDDEKVLLLDYLDIMSTAKKTNQIIFVVDHTLVLCTKTNGKWSKVITSYCGYGENGFKLASKRVEGDKTTPIGAFKLPLAFGLGTNPGTSMTYRQITKNSYWSGAYDTYNTWVESSTPMSGEHLIDYYQYKYAMAIGFNMDPVVYKRGSAIFLHCKSTDRWYTSGCVSVPEDVMLKLLKSTKNGAYIVIVPDRTSLKSY